MRRNTLLLLLVLALATGLLCAPAAQAVRLGLTAELSLDKTAYERGEEIALRFTLRNDSAHDLYVLKWRTPLDGFFGNVLDVTRDGAAVAYVGPIYKLGKPGAAQFLRVPAGGAVSATFDPTAVYAMDVTGNYALRFRTELLDESALRGEKVAGVDSGVAELYLSGWTEEEAAEWAAGQQSRGFQTKALPPGYVGCSPSQQNDASAGLNMAETMANESYSHLVGTPSGDSRYVTWFGTFDSKRYSAVKDHFLKEKNAFGGSTFTFFCDCTQPGTYAYVYANRPFEIHLCPVYWSAPVKGTDSKGGTIVHETSHFTVIAGTSDYAYGQTACKKLAIKSPRKAYMNADSHEYYAEQGTP